MAAVQLPCHCAGPAIHGIQVGFREARCVTRKDSDTREQKGALAAIVPVGDCGEGSANPPGWPLGLGRELRGGLTQDRRIRSARLRDPRRRVPVAARSQRQTINIQKTVPINTAREVDA